MIERVDVAVIGGGILGLATANALLEQSPGLSVTVLEKEDGLARHQTGRNSGVIHSGIYYRPGSAKAVMCRSGSRSMVEFAERHGIDFEVCGKLIVATDVAELPRLRALYDRGVENGLPVEMLGPSGARDFEPHVSTVGAIRVASTGIIDYVGVCRRLSELIVERGGGIRLGSEVTAFDRRADGVVLRAGDDEILAGTVVNCGGLQCDLIARSGGGDPEVQIIPFRGEYFELVPTRRTRLRT